MTKTREKRFIIAICSNQLISQAQFCIAIRAAATAIIGNLSDALQYVAVSFKRRCGGDLFEQRGTQHVI